MFFLKYVWLLFPVLAKSSFLGSPMSRTCGTTTSFPITFSEQELAYKSVISGLSGNYSATATKPKFSKAKPIQVYFHVTAVNRTRRGGWIPDEEIASQIQILNSGFNSSGLSFVLAKTLRNINKPWYEDGFDNPDMISARRIGGVRDLNIITEGGCKVLGVGTLPSDYSESPKVDAVVLCHESLPKGSLKPFNEGKAAIHEVGHWVGLIHPAHGGCNDREGDGVDDTPPEDEPAVGCPHNRDSCRGDGLDPIHNYMDYTVDSCQNEFTLGQAVRMRGQLAKYRGIPA